jgi:hypothetical protein
VDALMIGTALVALVATVEATVGSWVTASSLFVGTALAATVGNTFGALETLGAPVGAIEEPGVTLGSTQPSTKKY